MTLTFVVESMAAANAIFRSRRAKQMQKKDSPSSDQQSTADAIKDDDSDSSCSSSASPSKALVCIASFSYRFAKLNSRLANLLCIFVLSRQVGTC